MGTYHHGDLRAALVAHGIAMLERDGLASLTLRAVAREVGVSHAAPARHFADGTAFLAAIAAAGYRELAAHLTAGDDAPPEDALLASGRGYVAFALAHPEWYRAVFHPALVDAAKQDGELREASTAAFAVLCDQVERAMAAGSIDARPVRDVALTLWSAVHGVCSLAIDHQLVHKHVPDGAAAAEVVLANVYLGLRPEHNAVMRRPRRPRRQGP